MICVDKDYVPQGKVQSTSPTPSNYCMCQDRETGKLVLAKEYKSHFRAARNNRSERFHREDFLWQHKILRTLELDTERKVPYTADRYSRQLIQDTYVQILEGPAMDLREWIVPNPYKVVANNINFNHRDQWYSLHRLITDPEIEVTYYNPYLCLANTVCNGQMTEHQFFTGRYYYAAVPRSLAVCTSLLCTQSKKFLHEDVPVCLERGQWYTVNRCSTDTSKFEIMFDTCKVVLSALELGNYFATGYIEL